MSARAGRQALAFAVAVLLTASTGCGRATPGSDSPVKVVTGAATRLAGFRSYRLATDWQTAKAGGRFPSDYSAKIVSYVDVTHQRARSEMTVTTNGVTDIVTRITIGGDQWIKGPQLGIDAARPWLHQHLKHGFSVADATGAIDPTLPLRRSGVPGAKTTKIGTAVVRGVTTTRYSITIPASDLVAAGVPTSGDARMDVWIDGQGLIRRVVTTASISPDSDSRSTTGKIETVSDDYWDFGAVDEVSPPPATQVTGG